MAKQRLAVIVGKSKQSLVLFLRLSWWYQVSIILTW